MAWNLSTGAQIALLSKQPSVDVQVIAATISFGDGDGTGSTDTINDSGSGFGSFADDDWVLIIGGTNNGVFAQVITAAAAKLEIIAGSLTAEAAGSARAIVKIDSGSFAQVFANAVLDGYSGTRPSSGADAAETGTKLITLTKDAAAFVAGTSTNGINFGNMSGTTLQRAIDPNTGIAEVIRGIGLFAGTVGYCRLYANDYTSGVSTSAIRADGVASDSGGGDVNFSTTRDIVVGVYSEISSITWTIAGV
jgi:hypothetical protein